MASVGNPARTVPAGVRRAVIERDGYVCRLCGCPVAHRRPGEPHGPRDLHLDHVIEWAAGGANTVENLRVCCAACNLGRPKPSDVVRRGHIGFEWRNGTYYWTRDDYEPPKRARKARGRSIQWIAAYLDLTPAQVFGHVVSGTWPATGGAGPISVELPAIFDRDMSRYEDRLDREEAARAEAEANRVRNREEREAEKKRLARSGLDAERVEHWRQVIAEGRRLRAKK